MSTPPAPPQPGARRLFLRLALRQGGRTGALAAAAMVAMPARPAPTPGPAGARDLALAHLHTRERLALVFAHGNDYLPPALQTLNHFLRDHYSGQVGVMDPLLYDLMHQIRSRLGARMPFEIISGYRAPATNAHLQATRGGGVARRSLHMEGRAVDLRLPGVPLAELRDAALDLRAGGVGYYPRQQFVHIDTGRVRSW
jgi:uncharacterized protein YcbK (DUF882 family)